MARILHRLSDEFESTVHYAERKVTDGGSDLFALLDKHREVIERLEDDEWFEDNELDDLIDSIETLFRDTIDTVQDACSDFDVDIDLFEDGTAEHFEAIMRDNGFDALADKVGTLRYW